MSTSACPLLGGLGSFGVSSIGSFKDSCGSYMKSEHNALNDSQGPICYLLSCVNIWGGGGSQIWGGGAWPPGSSTYDCSGSPWVPLYWSY